MIEALYKLRGRYRMAMGFCPACNDDVPAMDRCPVCRVGMPYESEPPFYPVPARIWAAFKHWLAVCAKLAKVVQ
jgi:hypothetical protein